MTLEHTSSEISQSKHFPEITYVSTMLFHGAAEKFSFRSDYGFDNPENDGSLTLGEGVYLTDKIDHALDYSQVRQHGQGPQPFVYAVSAEACKFLDFRGENGNVPVPAEMVTKWRDFFRADLEKQILSKPDLGPPRTNVDVPGSPFGKSILNFAYFERESLKKYLTYLEELTATHRQVDVRELLGTAPVNWTQTEFSGNETAPSWSHLFRLFMTESMKFDGLIFLEAAEGELAGLHPSFIVYNLDSIHFSPEPVAVTDLQK